ncbi:MAG: hypothetical protein BWY68_00153 [bacterium ADurb.Bin400]|nr:MAG: hypothetical protein BWY68_00153 [bacterium ADurb.Bin400]
MDQDFQPKDTEPEVEGNGLPEIAPEIRRYLQALIIEKGIDNLPEDILAEVMYDMYVRFADYLIVNVSKALPEGKFYEFEEMMERGEPQTVIQAFIRDNTDYKKVMDETFSEFRETFLKG